MVQSSRIGEALRDDVIATARPDLAAVLLAVAGEAAHLAGLIARGPLAGVLGAATGSSNSDGDQQKALDISADERFEAALAAAGIAALVSEEKSDVQVLRPEGGLIAAIDPLDGSSNIDTNVSVGTIISLFEADAAMLANGSAFRQPGHAQLAAAFVIYGPQTSMLFTIGDGTHLATLDPSTGEFLMVAKGLRVPEGSPEFAINASNYRHWHEPVRAYIDDCVEGAAGPRGKNFNMRWIASLVADAYRIIVRGGVFLYPADTRPGYERGRLRLLYEANPIAMLIEQAGGLATDGAEPILSMTAVDIHARVPFIFGSRDKVERIARYHTEAPSTSAASPLFGQRGLLRH